MALSKPPCSAGRVVADRRADAALAAAGASNNSGVLPPDTVYEILLRLPGKDLCRLRAVCRPWRSLLSDDRAFAAAHAARHQEPLVVAGYAKHTSDGVLYDVLDLSGRVVKRARAAVGAGASDTENEWVVSARLDLVCVARGAGVSCRLLSPAAGVVARALPQGLSEQHAAHEREISHHTAMVALGQVAATGERKVLRVLHLFPGTGRQLYEITTLDGGGGRSQWRRIKDPACPVALGTWAVIDGTVFFFSSEFVHGQDVMPDRVASFDLETEEWRPTIGGPLSSSSLGDDGVAAAGHPDDDHMDWGEFSLADMNGCLVVTHRTFPSSMDLWFLMDVEKGSWVKKHSIQLNISYQHADHTVRPLLVLNDGRIVLAHIGNRGSLKIYDPRTSTSTDVAEIGPCVAVGLYNGSVLSLANGSS
ncbi:hypothetical protein GQ55_2G062000 [Panicum hallii var. hallii]|uniref:F-box domain-containing protein n=1 Tax=Panicum hallii var. hallii TaxID=1504633 RepID=A0A2T7EM34_9POAL|nr:hypothetical protein GQ55_2G062000 [Panicum hallii var. hallii]